MTTRELAVELVQQLLDALNQGDTRRLLTYYAEDARTLSPATGEVVGIEAIAKWWDEIFSRFPDWHASLTDLFVDGDRVIFFGSAGATDRNGWFGMKPTGQPFEYRAAVVLTLSQGKIIRDERIYDLSTLLQNFEKAQLDKELKLAAEIQHALLPQGKNTGPYFEVIGNSIPCRSIGGDFFESLNLSSGDLGVALGDVAGKGPGSAIVAAMIQGMFAVQLESETRASATVTHLNQSLISKHLQPRFATLAYGVLSPNGQFRHTNAGHNPPIVLKRDGVHRLRTGGPVLGVFTGARYEEQTLVLADGDTVIMFSDGVVEARNPDDCEYGEDRLLSCVMACATKPINDILSNILTSVNQFCEGAPQTDDITVLITRFRTVAAAK